jgi:sulfoxide reductase heme-binding subunit YedZ
VRRYLSGKPAKVVLFLLALAPLAMLLWNAYKGNLTANPIEYITHKTGTWTLRFLLITLAVTPLRRYLHLPELIRFRRMLGLFAFFYGSLHLTTYVWLDQFFDIASMVKDVARRPFITAGFTGFVMMVPLALTSTAGWVRRLGGKRWQRLHRLIYFSALAGVVHYYWLVKSDVRLPLLYGSLLALALLIRMPAWLSRPRTA